MTDQTFPSTDPLRTKVSGIRHTYRALTDAEKQAVDSIKDLGQALWDCVEQLAQDHAMHRPGSGRSYALAQTNIEQAVMWAVHGITNPEPLLVSREAQ